MRRNRERGGKKETKIQRQDSKNYNMPSTQHLIQLFPKRDSPQKVCHPEVHLLTNKQRSLLEQTRAHAGPRLHQTFKDQRNPATIP